MKTGMTLSNDMNVIIKKPENAQTQSPHPHPKLSITFTRINRSHEFSKKVWVCEDSVMVFQLSFE